MKALDPQPDPVVASGDVWAEIIAELPEGHVLRPLTIARREKGLQSYGVPVQRNNGLDYMAEARDEALDLMVYLRAANVHRSPDGMLLLQIVIWAAAWIAARVEVKS